MTFRSPDGERLLTTAEMTRRFGVNRRTVSGWARAGRMPAVKDRIPTVTGLHESWLFPEPVVAALIEGSRQERVS
jgi:hypothetical protein